MNLINHESVVKRMKSRLSKNSISKWIFFALTMFVLLILGVLLYRIFSQGLGY
jgi:phosphate transport system permease protein